MLPTNPGYYWAIWTHPTEGTNHDILWPDTEWQIVEVVDNAPGGLCEADTEERLAVFTHGVEQVQWLGNFKWGSPVLSRLEIMRMEARIAELEAKIG